MKFKSSIFGSLSANLFVPPNTIDFKHVFANFSTLLAGSPLVLIVLILLIIVYASGEVVAYSFDRIDAKMVSLLGHQPHWQLCCVLGNLFSYFYFDNTIIGIPAFSITLSMVILQACPIICPVIPLELQPMYEYQITFYTGWNSVRSPSPNVFIDLIGRESVSGPICVSDFVTNKVSLF